jgi:hypothetical protein
MFHKKASQFLSVSFVMGVLDGFTGNIIDQFAE